MEAWRHLREPLLTVWPVITEAMHLVGSPLAQDRLWQVLESRHLLLLPLDARDAPRMRARMSKYADRPMDLADAALVRVAERENLKTVFSYPPLGERVQASEASRSQAHVQAEGPTPAEISRQLC